MTYGFPDTQWLVDHLAKLDETFEFQLSHSKDMHDIQIRDPDLQPVKLRQWAAKNMEEPLRVIFVEWLREMDDSYQQYVAEEPEVSFSALAKHMIDTE